MKDERLTTHEKMLLNIDDAIRDPESPSRDEVTDAVRADRLANSMDGVDGRSAADYANTIRDLLETGDVADLGRLRLTERGALRVRELRAHSIPIINRRDFDLGPEPYLGWYLEGEAGPPMEPTSYVCYATEDRGDSRFQVTLDVSALNLDRAAKYNQAATTAFAASRGHIFLGTWTHGREYGMSLPIRARNLPTPQIRDALIRGLHRLYEDAFQEEDVTVDYAGVALALGVPDQLVRRAAEHLMETGVVSDGPAADLPPKTIPLPMLVQPWPEGGA